MPNPTVLIAFDLSLAGAGDFFTIGQTVLGSASPSLPLVGDALVDISADVEQVSIRRGRSRETDRFDAGTATIVVANEDRLYDPAYKVTQSATGGDTTYEIDVSGTTYVVHEFTTVGTATFTPGVVPLRGVEYLVVAGGGSGGSHAGATGAGGGGGAGGLIIGSTATITAAQTVVVGAGGVGASSGGVNTAGANSSFGLSVAVGGGAGARLVNDGGNGGSGGGASGSAATARTGGLGTSGQGNNGGDNFVSINRRAGGGGGAGGVGANATSTTAGNGGLGLASSITGASLTYAAGGGGGAEVAPAGSGGSSIGGNGGATGAVGTGGAINTGSGGGGGSGTATGGNGGSGIVIVRYPKVAFPSPFTPSLIPRKAVAIEVDNQRIFTGQVEDIDLTYNMNNESKTIFKAADGISLLSRIPISASSVPEQLTGERVNDILDDAQWPGLRRSVDTGVATLASGSIAANTNVVDYLNQIAESEPGFTFIDRQGNFQFRDRRSSQVLSDYKFSDQLGDLRFSGLDIEYGTERLYTRVIVTLPNGTTITTDNLSSQAKYGINDLNIDSLLSSVDQAEDLSTYYTNVFSEPKTLVRQLDLPAFAYSDLDLGKLLTLELGALVEFEFTPNGIGDPISQALVVESIEHNFAPNVHLMRLKLSQGLIGFILDQSRLDQDTLGF
jgi:hypothetical protein